MAEARKQLLVDNFLCALISRGERMKTLTMAVHVRDGQQTGGKATVRSEEKKGGVRKTTQRGDTKGGSEGVARCYELCGHFRQ